MATLIGTPFVLHGELLSCGAVRGIAPDSVRVFAPTGLSLRVRLLRSLPERFKVDIKVKEGTHQSENAGAAFLSTHPSLPLRAWRRFLSPQQSIARRKEELLTLASLAGQSSDTVNKQLNDKERVAGTCCWNT